MLGRLFGLPLLTSQLMHMYLARSKYPDCQGIFIFQLNLYDKSVFGSITKCVDYVGVLTFKRAD